MSFRLVTGTPGSGKTTLLLEEARAATAQGRRVLWVGLPAQRAWVYRQATRESGLLGFEFISGQQLCYRLLGRAQQLRPLRVGTERLTLVAQALLELRREVPAPGEARLFSAAIAELKRHGLTPDSLNGTHATGELARLQEVFSHYERLKGQAWDYDDYRLGAVHLAEAGLAQPDAQLVIVDGYRELLPLELRLYQALAANAQVRVALPAAPVGLQADEHLPARPATTSVFSAPNEVAEARWLLRSLKADLAAGHEPLDLALVIPARDGSTYIALAGEYGVPLMDETPRTLTDTRAGQLLAELLAFPQYPTASGLLALPGLEQLAAAAFRLHLTGENALLQLARELDQAGDTTLEQQLRDWLELLSGDQVTAGTETSWAAELTELVCREAAERELASEAELAAFQEQALQRAREAAQLTAGASFREWWAALLAETWLPDQPPAGVALLNMTLASGRHYRKAYLAGATEGSYGAFETEDYFIDEDLRAALPAALPRRYQGADAAVHAELLSMADELVITWPESSQGGTQQPETALTGSEPGRPLPDLPAGSPLELADGTVYTPDFSILPTRVELPAPTVEDLRFHARCPFRFWASRLTLQDRAAEESEWWEELRRDLLAQPQLSDARLAEIADRHPAAASWLHANAGQLQSFRFRVTLPVSGSGPHARIEAAGRQDGQPALYRFTAPATVVNEQQAQQHLRDRWTERWAAAYLLSLQRRDSERVYLYVWPLLGEPVAAGRRDGLHEGNVFLEGVEQQAAAQLERYTQGDIAPQPSRSTCRTCEVFDLCRLGVR